MFNSSNFKWNVALLHLKILWTNIRVQLHRRRGCKLTPKSLDLSKIWAKSLNIRAKMTPNVVWPRKWHPKFAENHMKTFFEGHTKRGLHDLCGRKFVGKKSYKIHSAKFGAIWAKILRTSKNVSVLTLMLGW